jgi:hypothetical protein
LHKGDVVDEEALKALVRAAVKLNMSVKDVRAARSGTRSRRVC